MCKSRTGDRLFHRGSRVFERDGSPLNTGSITAILHRNDGTFASVRWDNGWKSNLLPIETLDTAPEIEHPTEYDVLSNRIRRT